MSKNRLIVKGKKYSWIPKQERIHVGAGRCKGKRRLVGNFLQTFNYEQSDDPGGKRTKFSRI